MSMPRWMEGIQFAEIMEPEKAQDCAGIFCVSLLVIGIIALLIWAIVRWCKKSSCDEKEPFANDEYTPQRVLYNPLYTSPDIALPGSYIYTQPPGDTNAASYAGTIQGTSGEFLPLQGRAAGVFMKNSSNNNLALPSQIPGNVGGYPNYTEQIETPEVSSAFNDFGMPGMESNSYLLDGANTRVCNSGQKCDNLPAQDWWPTVEKGTHGYALQASDELVPCGGKIKGCSGAKRFLESKFQPRWKSVFKK